MLIGKHPLLVLVFALVVPSVNEID